MSELEEVTSIDGDEAGFWEVVNLAYAFTDGQPRVKTREEYRSDLFGCRYPRYECKHENPDKHNPLAFLPWCHRWGINPKKITKAELKRWIAELAASGQAPGTQARRVSAVASFYESLFADEVLDVNPVQRLRAREKPKRREPGTAGRALTDEQAMALMDAADADGPRSALIIALLTYLGMRVTEVVELKVEDYLAAGDYGPQITYTAKGGKVMVKTLDEFVDERVRAWLAVRPKGSHLPALQPGARGKRAMVCAEDGEAITRQTVFRLVLRLGEAAGVPGRVTPHDLRRTFASLNIKAGTPIRDLQKDMGHAKSETTESYDRSAQDPRRSPAHVLARRHAEMRRRRKQLGDEFAGWAEGEVRPEDHALPDDWEGFDSVSGY